MFFVFLFHFKGLTMKKLFVLLLFCAPVWADPFVTITQTDLRGTVLNTCYGFDRAYCFNFGLRIYDDGSSAANPISDFSKADPSININILAHYDITPGVGYLQIHGQGPVHLHFSNGQDYTLPFDVYYEPYFTIVRNDYQPLSVDLSATYRATELQGWSYSYVPIPSPEPKTWVLAGLALTLLGVFRAFRAQRSHSIEKVNRLNLHHR